MTDLPVVDESVVFKAVTESYAPATKTAMDGLDVVWSADDQVAVFQGNEYYDLFKVTSESVGDTEATFTLQEDRDASNNALPYNGAFYPVSKNMEAYDEDGTFVVWNFALPTTQKYVTGSFANGAFPMIAVSDDNMFEFKNVLGAMKLQLKGDRKVKSIAVTDNAGNPLAGSVRVSLAAGEDPEASFEVDMMYGTYETTVTLDCGEGVQLSETEATEFFIALPATDFENGFTVTLTDTEYNVVKFQSKANDNTYIERSAVLVMPELDVESLTQDVELKAVPSMNDVALDIKVNVEGADGFYGIFVNEPNWLSYKSYFEMGYVPFTQVLQGTMVNEMPACRYDLETSTISLTQLGLSEMYLEAGVLNDVAPNSKYYVLVVPAFADKDAAMNQGGGADDGLLSLDDEESSEAAGYTLADAIIYEVSTSGFVTGGTSTLTSTKEEGYTTSYVTIVPSTDVEYMYYKVYGADEDIPEDYLDNLNSYNNFYYDPSMELVYCEVGNDYNMLPGTSWKVAVVLVDGEGKASQHVISVDLKAIPYSESLDAMTISDYGYDETAGEMYAVITEWPDEADIYYAFNYQTEAYTGWELADAQADILDGAYSYTKVEEADINNGKISVSKAFVQNTRAAQRGFHVVAVKDGQVGTLHFALINIPAKSNN